MHFNSNLSIKLLEENGMMQHIVRLNLLKGPHLIFNKKLILKQYKNADAKDMMHQSSNK